MRSFKIGKYVIPLWLIAVLLISAIGGVVGYYIWRTLTVQLEVKEPLEITAYPSQLSLYPGEVRDFNVTLLNHASVNYSVIFDFHLSNTTYQTNYVTFSNEIYAVIPGQQNLTAWLRVESSAPPANVSLTIDLEREVYPYGLVGYWRFDEGKGIIAFDSSGTNNHGILNGPSWTDGKYGGALSFDGINDYVEIPYDSSLDLTTSITIEAWVKVDGTTGDYQIIVAKWYPGGNLAGSYVLEFQPDGITPWLVLRTWNRFNTVSNVTVPFGSWTHIAGTYDGSVAKIYINGTLTGSQEVNGTITVGNQLICIGAHSPVEPADRNWFKGSMDNVMIYNRALSAEEIEAHYLGSVP